MGAGTHMPMELAVWNAWVFPKFPKAAAKGFSQRTAAAAKLNFSPHLHNISYILYITYIIYINFIDINSVYITYITYMTYIPN